MSGRILHIVEDLQYYQGERENLLKRLAVCDFDGFPCLLSLSAVRVRKQQRAEDLSNRADVLSYPYTSSPLLVSVYSCISSASLGPQLGVSCNVTQATHLEAACYAEEAEMPLLCCIDTYEKRTV